MNNPDSEIIETSSKISFNCGIKCCISIALLLVLLFLNGWVKENKNYFIIDIEYINLYLSFVYFVMFVFFTSLCAVIKFISFSYFLIFISTSFFYWFLDWCFSISFSEYGGFSQFQNNLVYFMDLPFYAWLFIVSAIITLLIAYDFDF